MVKGAQEVRVSEVDCHKKNEGTKINPRSLDRLPKLLGQVKGRARGNLETVLFLQTIINNNMQFCCVVSPLIAQQYRIIPMTVGLWQSFPLRSSVDLLEDFYTIGPLVASLKRCSIPSLQQMLQKEASIYRVFEEKWTRKCNGLTKRARNVLH